MKYIVFLTENVKCCMNGSNRIYIGIHGTDRPDVFDGYLGDGIRVNQVSTFMYPKTPLQEDVKKHGVNSFRRMTLYVCDSYVEACEIEQSIVNDSFVAQSHVYNMSMSNEHDFRIGRLYQFDTKGNLLKEWEKPLDATDTYCYPVTRFMHACEARESLLGSFWSTCPTINVGDYKVLGNHNCITYVYSTEGKLLAEFWNIKALLADARFNNEGRLTMKEVSEAIKHHGLIGGKHYVLNYMTALFTPSPRRQYLHETFHVYEKNGTYVGMFKGKEVMKVIDLHSWAKISRLLSNGGNWYKNWYVSLEPVDSLPERIMHNVRIDVYDRYGNFIESSGSIKETKEKYNIPSAKMKRIQQGDKYFGDFMFKYSK